MSAPIKPAKRVLTDMTVTANRHLNARTVQLQLQTSDGTPLPEALPGQFVQVDGGHPDGVLLRRPISINDCDATRGRMTLLIANAGRITSRLCHLQPGQTVNILTPLGHGFPLDVAPDTHVVLIGGGVGMAPILFYGRWLKERLGIVPDFVLGARSSDQLMLFDEFGAVGRVHITTDDGSAGIRGYAADALVLRCGDPGVPQLWATCGPAPMMKAIAALANRQGIPCYASLENMMACGLGACLCCVENTVRGNVCVCTEGPVFNTDELNW